MNDKGLSDEEVYEACKDGDPMTKVRLIMVFLLFFHAFFFFKSIRTSFVYMYRTYIPLTGNLSDLFTVY